MTTINPIIPGFSPDPSLVKVGEWYFLVNSSFHVFPGLPIYASKDLILWKYIGNGIHRQSQLSLTKSDTSLSPWDDGQIMTATGGLYAPTIRYHEGVFYIVCTNIVHHRHADGSCTDQSDNFIITTEDIWSSKWGDPIYFDFQGIDPSLFIENGKAYIHGSQGPGPFTKIQQFEVNLETGEKLSPEKTIWLGTGGIYPEGPHLYKRNGWYYLIISEGGTHDNHMVTMARSKDIWGPYEPNPDNPILTARGTNEYIQYTGHCDAFEDYNGNWWGVCLGVRKEVGGRFIMGRETFLTRGNWDGEWLSFDRVTPNPKGLEGQVSKLVTSPNVDFLYLRDPDLSKYQLSNNGTAVTVTASPIDLSHPEASPTFIGKRQRVLEGESIVTISARSNSWEGAKLKAGIACYKDEHRYIRLFYDASASEVVYELVNNAQKTSKTNNHPLKSFDSLTLRITYTELQYSLSFTTDPRRGEPFILLGTVDTLELTDPDFVGPTIGAFAVAAGGQTQVEFSEIFFE